MSSLWSYDRIEIRVTNPTVPDRGRVLNHDEAMEWLTRDEYMFDALGNLHVIVLFSDPDRANRTPDYILVKVPMRKMPLQLVHLFGLPEDTNVSKKDDDVISIRFSYSDYEKSEMTVIIQTWGSDTSLFSGIVKRFSRIELHPVYGLEAEKEVQP